MKKFILLIFLFISLYHVSIGQQWNAYRDQINSIFANVNNTPITTGLLADYGMELIYLPKYNGTLMDTNRVDMGALRAIYTSLYSMRFNSNFALSTPAQYNTAINNYLKANATKMPIVGVHVNYQQFKTNATSLGLTVVSNKLYCSNTTAPYEQKTSFAIALGKARLEGATHQFIFPSSLFKSNTGKTISLIQVDFGNGQGYQTITMNTAKNINYSTGGKKTLKVKITYTDNSYFHSHSDFFVTIPKSVAAARFAADTVGVDLTARRAYSGQPASGHITIGYSGTDHVLDKPLIVAEGFDPNNDYNYENFINFTTNGGILNLRADLETDGYDIVFVNYDNGTDYIQNNAYLLQRVIEYVNSNKTGSEKNVVLGLSMGGLVARYALRDMEVNGLGLNHDTRLYISHDSPHQGANVPLGFQAMVRQLSGYAIGLGVPGLYYNLSLTDISPELGTGVNILQSPATRQMLKYQLSGVGNFISNDNFMHNTFMTEYSNLGYPQQTQKNIAISSGSECAQPQDIAAYGEFLNVNQSADFRYWSSLVTSVLGVFTSEPLLAVG